MKQMKNTQKNKTKIAVGLILVVSLLLVWQGLHLDTIPVADASYRAGYSGDAEYNAWAGAEVDTEVYLPFVNSDPTWKWQTTVVVQNTSSQDATVALHYYDTTGTESNVVNDTLPPLGSRAYPTTGVFSGSLVIDAHQPVAAIAIESPIGSGWTGDTLMSYRGIGSVNGATAIVLGPIRNSYLGYNTFFAVQNLQDAMASITLDFCDANGLIVHTQSDNLPPRSAHWYSTEAIPQLPVGFSGHVYVHSATSVAGVVHVVGQSGDAVAYRHLGQPPPAAAEAPAPAPVLYRLYFAQLVDSSAIDLYNLGGSQAIVEIDLLGQNGAPAATIVRVLPAGGNASILLSQIVGPGEYSAHVSSDQILVGLATTRWSSYLPDTITGYSGVSQSGAGVTAYVPFVRKTADVISRISVQNTGSAAADVSVEYYDAGGSQVGSAESATIPAGSAHTFDQQSSSLSTPFQGSATVTSSQPAVVVGYVSSKQQATSTYTISGQVTDNAGSGIADVTVTATASGASGLGTTATATAVTDSSGNYTLTVGAIGTYLLTFHKTGYTFEPVTVTVSASNPNPTADAPPVSQGWDVYLPTILRQ